MQLLDGKTLADEILEGLAKRLSNHRASRAPRLAFLRVGEDPASVVYVNRKSRIARSIGIDAFTCVLPPSTDKARVLSLLDEWNREEEIDGILVQAPLPTPEFQQDVFLAIAPEKDVDGFHPTNFGKLAQEIRGGFIPCTPKGILRLLRAYDIPLSGKRVAVLGRSLIVGRPLTLLLQSRSVNATVTLCHSKTQSLAEITRHADVVVLAVGKPNTLRAEMIGDGAVVIDVGMNRVEDALEPRGYRLCGDACYNEIAAKCSYITPVPGGVGPMTIAMLMENVIEAFERRCKLSRE